MCEISNFVLIWKHRWGSWLDECQSQNIVCGGGLSPLHPQSAAPMTVTLTGTSAYLCFNSRSRW